MGSHNLNVERGKWAKLKYEDRLCSCCHDIEDEYHVAIICPRYEDLRKKYIPKYLIHKPSMFKFIDFMNTSIARDFRNLGKFVHLAFEIHSKLEIYNNELSPGFI